MRTTVLILMLTVLPAFASEPGQPLDCSDWVFLEPGLSCSHYLSYPCNPGINEWCDALTEDRQFLSNGRRFTFRHSQGSPCPGTGSDVDRVELVAFDGVAEQLVGYLEGRCNGDTADRAQWGNGEPTGIAFEEQVGRLLVFDMTSFCTNTNGWCGAYSTVNWVAAIDGFPTTFEILQTYTPTPNTLSFRVPAMPEGFPAADYFDTYYGDLATVGDWSQAQPLQCGYPASPASVGEYLEVEDPLPSPEPGHGRYYVTAVHYQGQTRYGRKSTGGVLSGRDPGVLPVCEE